MHLDLEPSGSRIMLRSLSSATCSILKALALASALLISSILPASGQCGACGDKTVTVTLSAGGKSTYGAYWDVTLTDLTTGFSTTHRTGDPELHPTEGYWLSWAVDVECMRGHNYMMQVSELIGSTGFEVIDPQFNAHVPRSCSQPKQDYPCWQDSGVVFWIPGEDELPADPNFGDASTEMGSVLLRFGMGRTFLGNAAGDLCLTQPAIGLASYSPAALYSLSHGSVDHVYPPDPNEFDYLLQRPFDFGGEEIVRVRRTSPTGGDVWEMAEVRSAGALALVERLTDGYGFKISFHRTFTTNPLTHRSTPSGNPVSVWRVENPDAGGYTLNDPDPGDLVTERVLITSKRWNFATAALVPDKTYEFATLSSQFHAGGKSWDLSRGPNSPVTHMEEYPEGTNKVKSTTVTEADGTVSSTRKTIKDANGNLLEEWNGDTFTMYHYRADQTLASIERSDGSVEEYEIVNNVPRVTRNGHDISDTVTSDESAEYFTSTTTRTVDGFPYGGSSVAHGAGGYFRGGAIEYTDDRRPGPGGDLISFLYSYVPGTGYDDPDFPEVSASAGKPFANFPPDGTASVFVYDMVYRRAAGVTTVPPAYANYLIDPPDSVALAPGVYVRAIATRFGYSGGAYRLIPGKSTQVVSYTDGLGHVCRESTYVCTADPNPDGWDGVLDPEIPTLSTDRLLKHVQYSFDADDNLIVASAKYGNVSHSIYQASYLRGLKQSEYDEMNLVTNFSGHDYQGRPTVQTRTLIRPLPTPWHSYTETVSRLYSWNGRVRAETKFADNVTLSAQSWTYDTADRLTSQTAGERTRVYEHYNKTATTPARVVETAGYFGLTYLARDVSTNADGRITSVQSDVTPAELHQHLVVAPETMREIVTRGNPSGVNAQKTIYTHSSGSVLREEEPLQPGASKITHHEYDYAARPTAVYVGPTANAANLVESRTYDELGQLATVTQHRGGSEPDTVITYSDHYEKDSSGIWWHVTSNSLEGAVHEKASGFAFNERSVRKKFDATGQLTATVTVTLTSPGFTQEETVYPALGNHSVVLSYNGLSYSITPEDGTSTVLITRDDEGREVERTNPATPTHNIVTNYDPSTHQISSVTCGSEVTSYTYAWYPSAAAGLIETKTADGTTTYYGYDQAGRLSDVTGDTYPLSYTYDALGRIDTMFTYPATPASAITRWIYYPGSTFLKQKQDATQKGAVFTYDARGGVYTRTWARIVNGTPVVTTYNRNQREEIIGITYNDGTPGLSMIHDAAGNVAHLTDALGDHDYLYNARRQLTSESDLNTGRALEHHFDAYGRPTGYTFDDPTTPAASSGTVYHYDPATGRPTSIEAGSRTITYGYDYSRGWLSTIVNGVLTTTRSADDQGRLLSLTTRRGSVIAGTTYEYNRWNDPRHLRWSATGTGAAMTWGYEYNSRGELISAGDGHDESWYYDYDGAGNRTQARFASFNTNASDSREWVSDYTPNVLNQYTSRTVPPIAEVRGLVAPANSAPVPKVAVNGLQAYLSPGTGYWYKQVPAPSTPAWLPIEISAGKPGNPNVVDTASGHLYVPESPESFLYDEDGNLIQDSRWAYSWDAENRLVGMATRLEAVQVGAPSQRLRFTYDGHGRRRVKAAVDPASSMVVSTQTFEYDGYNMVAEYSNGALVRTYHWGLDVSGSLDASAGIGGILDSKGGASGTTLLPVYDGNGNIIAAFNTSSLATASIEYSPFGEILRRDSDAAELPFRWSTRYTDDETGLVVFPHRYYSPQLGRWLSRDPLGEAGGIGLYAYVGNRPHDQVDPLGLTIGPNSPHDLESCKCTCEWATGLHVKADKEDNYRSPDKDTQNGAILWFSIKMRYGKMNESIGNIRGNVSLEYHEFFTYVPPTNAGLGEVANHWYEQVQMVRDHPDVMSGKKTMFDPWDNRQCHKNGEYTIGPIKDAPRFPVSAGIADLWIHVVLKNPPCAPKSAPQQLVKDIHLHVDPYQQNKDLKIQVEIYPPN